jgi:nucleotide-binding universal stress UspA family protein
MHIVLGIDGSEPSLLAHRLLLGAAWPRPLGVTLVAAYERPFGWTGAAAFTYRVDDEASVRHQLGSMLAELAEPLRRIGIVTETTVRAGGPAAVVAGVAQERRADLILVGNRGHGPARATLMGSVSADLVDHAPCPVLVARRPRVARMLFATDGSETAAHAADILAAWRAFPGARIDVIHVAQRTGGSTVSEQMARRLDQAGWLTQPFVRVGDAAREITRAATELDDDLIVTGSRGLGDLKRIIAGSVAHDVVLHARTSVLVMRGQVRAPVGQRAAAATLSPV